MADHSRYAIGIDVGGTKIAGGLVELEAGVITNRYVASTAAERGGQAVLHDVCDMAAALFDLAAGRGIGIVGIGLGVCELVDPQGNVTSAHTIDWAGLPVARSLAPIAPAVIEADVRAHALAEAVYGAGRNLREFVFVSVGTGISSCLVLDGKPHPGARGNALVLASSAITTTCAACGLKSRLVLEDYASGPALVARYNQAMGTYVTRAEQVCTLALAGDQVAVAVTQSAGEALGASLGWLVNVLDPQALVVGGGLGMAEGLYWNALLASARMHIWAEAGRELPILHAKLGNDAGIIGAARKTLHALNA